MSIPGFIQVGRANARSMITLLEGRDTNGLIQLANLWGTPLTEKEALQLIDKYAALPQEYRTALTGTFTSPKFT